MRPGELVERRAKPADRLLAVRGCLSAVVSGDPCDIFAAQKLRYTVFYEELRAEPDAAALATRSDRDEFDALCDHVLVFDNDSPGTVVATYRILRQEKAAAAGGFYSQKEFDLAPLLQRHRDLSFFELGRSCVHPRYRSGHVVELLWQAIWNYMRLNGADVMFGCASLQGADPAAHAPELSFLARNFTAPESWKVRALESRFVPMDRLPPASYDARRCLRNLPPLLKGYIRLGCFIGEGAVLDHQFNTTDVFVLLPVSRIKSRYLSRFGTPASTPQLLMS